MHDPTGDGRPRSVVFVGNGFSASYVGHVLGDPYKSGFNDVPGPGPAQYLPSENDRFERSSLWDREKFPLLHSAMEESVCNGRSRRDAWTSVCASAAVSAPFIQQYENQPMIEATGGSLGMELRAYLWHLFKYYAHDCHARISETNPVPWRFERLLTSLLRFTRSTWVSFNYDKWLEDRLRFDCSQAKLGAPVLPTQDCLGHLIGRIPNAPVVLKPHGCVHHYAPAGFGGSPNWWLDEGRFIWGDGDVFVDIVDFPNSIPPIPTLVPRGHAGEIHLADPMSDVQQAIPLAVSDCEILIVFGFSAAPPDDDEFKRYLSNMKEGTIAVHVGRAWDRDNEAARLLRQAIPSQRYQFVDSETEGAYEAIKFIVSSMKPRPRPKKRADHIKMMAGPHYDSLPVELRS